MSNFFNQVLFSLISLRYTRNREQITAFDLTWNISHEEKKHPKSKAIDKYRFHLTEISVRLSPAFLRSVRSESISDRYLVCVCNARESAVYESEFLYYFRFLLFLRHASVSVCVSIVPDPDWQWLRGTNCYHLSYRQPTTGAGARDCSDLLFRDLRYRQRCTKCFWTPANNKQRRCLRLQRIMLG